MLDETAEKVRQIGRRSAALVADISDETQLIGFRDEVAAQHNSDRVHLLFNNAGIGGGGSLFTDSREAWDRTKVISGVRKAIVNRPVTEEQVLSLAERVESLRDDAARLDEGSMWPVAFALKKLRSRGSRRQKGLKSWSWPNNKRKPALAKLNKHGRRRKPLPSESVSWKTHWRNTGPGKRNEAWNLH